MRIFHKKSEDSIWTHNLILMALTVFIQQFGEGLLWATQTNFLVETLKLSGSQFLWLEGLRELPGLGLMFIAALTMRLPLSQRSAASLFIMGIGYGLYSIMNSYLILVVVAIVASIGMHSWMPLNSTLAMSLSTKEKSGRVLGTLASVGALASLAGMGTLSIVSRTFEFISLRYYYVFCGAFIIAAGFIVAKIPKTVGATDTKPPRMLLSPRYWLFYILTFLQGARKQVFDSFCTLYLVKSFGLRVWNISSLLFASSVLNMFAGPYIGRLIDRHGERKMVTMSYLLLILCCFGFATMGKVWILAFLLIAIKTLILFGIGLSTYVRRISPAEELTPTFSAGISINHITSVAMPLVTGVLLPIIGYTGIFWVTASIIVISLPFSILLRTDKIKSPETRELELEKA